MKSSTRYRLMIYSAFLLVGSIAMARPPENSYHLLKKYAFGAAEGSTTEYFDYITVDSGARRVYLSRGTAVQVMNADTGAVVGNISGFKRQHEKCSSGRMSRCIRPR